MRRMGALAKPIELPIRNNGLIVAVIETPSGSGNKVKFDPELSAYRLDRVLPAGMVFPFEFGFIPRTVAEDGDPLDVIVLLDSPVQTGTVVLTRLIGIIEGEQQDRGSRTWERNDRLVGVAGGPKGHAAMHSLRDLDPFRLESIESFFKTYHQLDGDKFRVTARSGVAAADAAIRKAHRAFLARKGAGDAGHAGDAA
jgi:inorganic pyrophosphatase